ncbi:hypothetical protein G6F63_016496 [Rhizopus arrhizus]|nr:hypothetical protein G6F63_016496 [Rhizopus arrhizus]KAG1391707.1 hypothetical protein G6F59_014818 [Rhizopus arrhizus]
MGIPWAKVGSGVSRRAKGSGSRDAVRHHGPSRRRGVLHRPAGTARAEAASGHRRDRSRAAVPNRRTGPAAGSGAGSAAPAHRHRDVAGRRAWR